MIYHTIWIHMVITVSKKGCHKLGVNGVNGPSCMAVGLLFNWVFSRLYHLVN